MKEIIIFLLFIIIGLLIYHNKNIHETFFDYKLCIGAGGRPGNNTCCSGKVGNDNRGPYCM